MADKLKQVAKDTSRKPSPGMLGSGYANKAAKAAVKRNNKLKSMLKELDK